MPKDKIAEFDLKSDTTFDAIANGQVRGKQQMRADSADVNAGNTLKFKSGVDGFAGGLIGSLTGKREKHFENAEKILQKAFENQTGAKPSPAICDMIHDAVRGKLEGAKDLHSAMGLIRQQWHKELINEMKQQTPDVAKQQELEAILKETSDKLASKGLTMSRSAAFNYAAIMTAPTPEEAVKLAKQQMSAAAQYDNGQLIARSLAAQGQVSPEQMAEVYGHSLRGLLENPNTNSGNLLRENNHVTGFTTEFMKQQGAQFADAVIESTKQKLNDAGITDPSADDLAPLLLESISENENSMTPEMKQFLGTGYKTAEDVLASDKNNAAQRLGSNASRTVMNDAIVLRSVNPAIGAQTPFGSNSLAATKSVQKLSNNAIVGSSNSTEPEQVSVAKKSLLQMYDNVGNNNGLAFKPARNSQGAKIGPPRNAPAQSIGNLAEQVASKAKKIKGPP